MLRIYLDAERLAKVRFLTDPAPLSEILMSLRMLHNGPDAGSWGRWRRHIRQLIPEVAAPLLDLVPRRGCPPALPGMLVPDLEAAMELLTATPADQLQTDLAVAFASQPMPPWVRQLTHGDRDALDILVTGLRAYYRTCLQPHQPHIRAAVESEILYRSFMIRDGLGSLLSSIHPTLAWRSPYLELKRQATNADAILVPNGRGLLLQPAPFCWHPKVRRAPDGTVVIAYPVWTPAQVTPTDRPEPDPLGALLGATRAGALRALAHAVHTTTELAHRLRIRPATASEHTAVLRRTGLITTTRRGPSVHHHITALGLQLLHGRAIHGGHPL